MTDLSTPGPPPGAATAHPKKRRRLRTKALALGVSSVVALGLLELAARAVPEPDKIRGRSLAANAFYESLEYPTVERPPQPPYRLDAELGFCLLPDLDVALPFPEAPRGSYRLRTDRRGLRDDRPDPATPPGARPLRILCVGDSMTFGPGVERSEAWPARLEARLGDALGRPVEVVNCGVCNWGQHEEDAFLEHRAPALEPALVVLQFTVANDVLDDLRVRNAEGRLVPDPEAVRDLSRHPAFELPFAETSRAYRLFAWHVARHVVRYRSMLDPARLARASDLVARARDLTARLGGAKLVVLIAPTVAQIDGGVAEAILGTHRINEAIAARCRADGIPCLDPTGRLRAGHRAQRLYFAKDMHWNPRGHDVVADATARFLVESLGTR